MLTLIKIILLGKWILLTPTPVDLGVTPLVITPDKSLSAITSGAYLSIDVTNLLNEGTNIRDVRALVTELFPPECLKVALIDKEKNISHLSTQGSSISDKKIYITFSSSTGINTKSEYETVEISSCQSYKNVTVFWVNHKK